MKRVIVATALLSVSLLPAQAQVRNHSLSIEVRPVSSGGATRSRNRLDIGEGEQSPGYYLPGEKNFSSTRKKGSGVGLEVEVRNLSQLPDQTKVEWYLLGKPVNGGDPFIFDQGSRTLEIGSASRMIVNIDSVELTSKTEKKLTLRSGYAGFENNLPSTSVNKSGSKVAGWIVRLLLVDNQVLQVRASSPSLETVGKDESQLQRLRKKQGKRK